MRRKFWTAAGVRNLLLLMVAAWILNGSQELAAQQPASGEPRFGLDQVWKVDLEIPSAEYAAIQPPPAAFGAFGVQGGAGAPVPQPQAPGRDTERNQFGTVFPWGQGMIAMNGRAAAEAKLRYSGDASYFMSAGALKRPWKIRVDGRSFLMQSMPLDASRSREALALGVFRAMKVPAPRSAFAEVTLTVPGQFAREYLGLYTVVEEIGPGFLKDQFETSEGLLLKANGGQPLAYLGDNWQAYAAWQPNRTATPEESRRVMSFAKLVNQGADEEFSREIESYLDVPAFLRFLAANALTSNLSGFFGIGQSDTLYLHPTTKQFAFIPGDLEQSFANIPFFGSPDDQMNLRLTKPYPGENKLAGRLLAIEKYKQQYRALLQDVVANIFTRERLTSDIAKIKAATAEITRKEQEAAAQRPPAPAGFGGFPGAAPPPALETFIEKRLASISSQLAGTNEGFVPPPFNFGFGGGGGGGGGGFQRTQPQAVTDDSIRDLVKAPAGFKVTLFGRPPDVNYPAGIAAGPQGELYVASDEQGSLGRTPGGGKVLRVVDANDDGLADKTTVFARVEHPRGVAARGNSVWVMHPPLLSVFHDDDGDGVSDRRDDLVTGLTSSQITERGGDHTTNCARMGIDGWLYIGVGDYGIPKATGKDGSTITMRGGGIVRVRPDGTELEIFCRGLRNPFDIAIDPYLNLFTRDNTNDGGGWDIRVSHLLQTANYGYSQLFTNFADEIMPTLGVFGNGGGTGGVFVQHPLWPDQYRNSLLTADWGRSEVYLHELSARGPSFSTGQQVFLTVPRATGLEIDAGGRLYVASWHGGSAASFEGPNVGFVIRVTPPEYTSQPRFNVSTASLEKLVGQLTAPEPASRLHAQGEILRRGKSDSASTQLRALAAREDALLAGRVAAIFTLKQLDGKGSHASLRQLAQLDAVREFALKALTDRATELEEVDAGLFVAALSDSSPRVRAQAAISLSRLGDKSVAATLLPLTSRPEGSALPTQRPLQNQPDTDRVIPHLAVQALVSLRAVDVCLAGLDGPHRDGALWALRWMHQPEAVDGLISRLKSAHDPQLRRGILVALIRLCQREADYDGSWWGIRPDGAGPYWDAVPWSMTDRVRAVLSTAVADSQGEETQFLKAQLARHRVTLPGVSLESGSGAGEQAKPVAPPKADPGNPNQIGNLVTAVVIQRALASSGDVSKGEALFRNQSCVACHTWADGQKPRGPHLVDIGKRYQPRELLESILTPSAKLAQGYEAWTFAMADGRVFSGFIVSERPDTIVIRESNSLERELKRAEIEQRLQQRQSAMPEGLAANLTPEQLSDLIAYLQSLK